MKFKVKMPVEIEIAYVRISVPVRYEEEDIPNDFPLRVGDTWSASVDMDTGKIHGWPIGKAGSLEMKVCDEGTYTLYGKDGNLMATREQDYVPHGVVPGEYGDYIKLEINADGIITNWRKAPNIEQFFPAD